MDVDSPTVAEVRESSHRVWEGTGRGRGVGTARGLASALGGLLLLEDVDGVVSHLLLRDEHILRAVDHKVPALVVRALAKVGELSVV